MKWIAPEYEQELLEVFELSMQVRKLGADAQKVADRLFLETLVRVHRAGEGAGFEGLKPAGALVDPKVAAADKSIEVGNLDALKPLVSHAELHALEERFEQAMALKDFDVNDLAAARKYIEAYVTFFKLAEGEDHDHGHHAHAHGH